MEHEVQRKGVHIHHKLCGHGKNKHGVIVPWLPLTLFSRRWGGLGHFRKDKKRKEMVDTTDAVHGAGNLPFQRRGVQAKRDAPELYAPGEGPTKCWKERLSGGGRKRAWSSVESMRRAKRESVRKFQDAKMCRRVEEFWVTTPTRCTQAQCRAQCPVPRRSLGRGHKRQGTSKSSSTFCRETVCLRRGGHRGSQRVVGEVQRNAAAILYQNPSQARQCRSIWKTTWRAAHSSPCTTKEGWLAPFKHQKSWCTRRCLSKYLDHGLQITAFPPNHWLCSAKDLHVVRGQSHGEPA